MIIKRLFLTSLTHFLDLKSVACLVSHRLNFGQLSMLRLRRRAIDVLSDVEGNKYRLDCIGWTSMDKCKCRINYDHHQSIKDVSIANDKD